LLDRNLPKLFFQFIFKFLVLHIVHLFSAVFAPGSGSNITGCCNAVSVLVDFSVFRQNKNAHPCGNMVGEKEKK